MTRIVAGIAKGRRLGVPATGTRPTSDRVREAVFASLDTVVHWPGSAVLDLFAGSGALGLEAMSRGAGGADLVDNNRAACRVIEANIAAVGIAGVRCHCTWVEHFLRRPPAAEFDLVFLDPPYEPGQAVLPGVLTALGPHLRGQARVVVETSARNPVPQWPPGYEVEWSRRFSDTAVTRCLWYGTAGE